MQKINVNRSNNRIVPHYLYDLSLPLPERRLQRLEFTSGIAAAAFLGVPPARIYISRTSKHRIWSEAQGRWFAVRVGVTKTENL
jgi:hypothetical protein